MHRLIRTFAVSICPKTFFAWQSPFSFRNLLLDVLLCFSFQINIPVRGPKGKAMLYSLCERDSTEDELVNLSLSPRNPLSLSLSQMSLTPKKLSKYCIQPNYRTNPYKGTVKQFHSLQNTASVLFCLLLYKDVCCGKPFELH